MTTRPRFVLPVLLLVASQSFATPLMYRAQTIISIPAPGEKVTLYNLSYHPKSWEAKVYSVELKVTSAEGADPVTGEWTFLSSNTDGQLHKVEIFTRLLDESGTQLGMESKHCMIGGGYHDFVCTVPLNMKAAAWKNVKSVRLVTDWQS